MRGTGKQLINRRTLLAMGVGGLAASALAAYERDTNPDVQMVIRPPSSERDPAIQRGSFVSQARGGVSTNWAIARPDGHTERLRVVIALHWRTGDAEKVMQLGMRRKLTAAVAKGSPPFAVASIDGGDTYWHARMAGGDSGAMVLDEFLPLLEREGLDTSRVGFMGWSMGGYGALLLGAHLGWPRVAAISTTSAAFWTEDAFPGQAFDGVEDFRSHSIWGLEALANIPLRIDCGTGDPMYDGARKYVAQLATPPAGGFSSGVHDGEFATSQLPGELEWIGPLLAQDP